MARLSPVLAYKIYKFFFVIQEMISYNYHHVFWSSLRFVCTCTYTYVISGET